MKVAKRGRRRIDPLRKARRDVSIIITYDAIRRVKGETALEFWRNEGIRQMFGTLRAPGLGRLTPSAAIDAIARMANLPAERVRRALQIKRVSDAYARSETARRTNSSITEVGRVLTDRNQNIGELVPDD